MAQSLDSIYQSLNSSYNPQRDLINSQIQQLPAQYQAQQQGLDAQKSIAFRGVDDQANSRGMLYSGVPTQQDNDYIAANYLPAVANLKNQQNQQQYGLQSALNNIGVQQQQQAFGQYNAGIQNDMTQNNLNQQIELAKQQAAMYAGMYGKSGSSGGGAAASNPYAVSQNSAGGLSFTYNGRPVTAAQYAQANGTTVASVLSQSGLAADRAIAQKIAAAKTSQQQAALKKQYSYIFGGV